MVMGGNEEVGLEGRTQYVPSMLGGDIRRRTWSDICVMIFIGFDAGMRDVRSFTLKPDENTYCTFGARKNTTVQQ